MKLKLVKERMNKRVFYDTGQLNFDGCSIREFILAGCILRKKRKNGDFYYQAELREIPSNAAIIVDLAKVLTEKDV